MPHDTVTDVGANLLQFQVGYVLSPNLLRQYAETLRCNPGHNGDSEELLRDDQDLARAMESSSVSPTFGSRQWRQTKISIEGDLSILINHIQPPSMLVNFFNDHVHNGLGADTRLLQLYTEVLVSASPFSVFP